MMIFAATPAALPAALKAAQSGDTLTLSGAFPTLSITRRSFAPPLTLDLSGASVGYLYVSQVQGVVLDRLRLVSPPLATSNGQAVRIIDSADVTIRSAVVVGAVATNGVAQDALNPDATGNVLGLPAGKGVNIERSQRVTVTGSDISLFAKAITFSEVDQLRVVDNDLHDLRTTPISGVPGDGVTITGNRTWGQRPWRFGADMSDGGADGDHGDALHLWTGSKPVVGLTVTGNSFEAGPMLGIYLDDNGKGLGFVGVTIERNRIVGGHGEGILLERASGSVAGNHLEWNGAGKQLNNAPRIIATAGSRDLTITGNRAVNYATKSVDLYKLTPAETATIMVKP